MQIERKRMKRHEGEKQMSWGVGGGKMHEDEEIEKDRQSMGRGTQRQKGWGCGHTCFCSIGEGAANAAQLVFF